MNFQPYVRESIIWLEQTLFQSPLSTNEQQEEAGKLSERDSALKFENCPLLNFVL